MPDKVGALTKLIKSCFNFLILTLQSYTLRCRRLALRRWDSTGLKCERSFITTSLHTNNNENKMCTDLLSLYPTRPCLFWGLHVIPWNMEVVLHF